MLFRSALVDHRLLGCPNGCVPTADEVNAWSHQNMYGGLRWVCVEARAKRLGVFGKCDHCQGIGVIYKSEEHERLHTSWKKTPPPEGEAYQIWETITEGSPISPPFLDPWQLARWMTDNDRTITKFVSAEQWYIFITEIGYATSGVVVSGKLVNGVEAAIEQRKECR